MRREGLLERESPIALIDELIDETARSRGSCLLVRGDAGIGKTVLLDAAAGTCREAGLNVLTACGDQLLSRENHALAAELLGPLLADAQPGIGDDVRHGAAIALGLRPASACDEPGSARSAVAVLRRLVFDVAANGPLAVLVDDAHCADAATAAWLAHLSTRLAEAPILLVLAVRSGDSDVTWARLDDHAAVRSTTLRPLSATATAQLLADTLRAPVDPEFAAACHDACGGKPFLVAQLARACAEEQMAPSAQHRGAIAEMAPAAVARASLVRVAHAAEDARSLARAVSVLGPDASLRLAARLAGLEPADALLAADALSDGGVLMSKRPLSFVHPLVKSAISLDTPVGERAQLHRHAAQLLSEEGADPVQVGAHLLACEPAADPEVVQLLRRAAREAIARGVPESAVGFLRRALDEPVALAARAELLGELGRSELVARDPAAIEHLGEAIELTDDAQQRLALTCSLAEVLSFAGRLREAHALMSRAIEELGDPDDALLVRLETARAHTGWGWSDPEHAARERLPRLQALAKRTGPAGRELLIYVGLKLMVAGETPQEGVALVRRGLDDGRFIEDETSDAVGAVQAVAILAFHDELAEAERHIEHMLDDARRRGSVMGYAGGLGWRAFSALRRGSIPSAEADAGRALDLIEEHELHFAAPFALEFLVEALLERGQLEDCEAALARVPLEPFAGTLPGAYLLEARSRLRIAQGRPHDAIADLRQAGEILQAIGIENPNVKAWRSTLALALPAAASESHKLIEAELDRAQQARQARGLGVALRAKGLLTGGEAGITLLEDASRTLAECPSRLEQARALTELGGALRRANRRADAREPLRQAVELAHRCGATVLAHRALDELKATGARPRSLLRTGIDALTPTERRISAMAAQGLSNPEIAQALFLARKTVENHLGNTYQKLDIGSRDELPRVLSDAAA